jgi:hypothetical protein
MQIAYTGDTYHREACFKVKISRKYTIVEKESVLI